MIKIKSIHIKRFRSIMDLKLDIDQSINFISICGENNAGKTNALRALNIFFNSEKYEPEKDSPFHKFEGTQGGLVYPDIVVEFFENDSLVSIQKTFDRDVSKTITKGIKDGNLLDVKNCLVFLKKVHFFFIESINVEYPKLINNAVDKVFEVSYAKSRFAGAKGKLKTAYEDYTNGLLEILSDLSNEINPLFQEYRDNWNVNFTFENDITKFRDLIADDIEFSINDSSNKYIESKGSGLQRLAFILLHFKIIQKLNKNVILCVDEPDIFLHSGLQRKLLSHFKGVTDKAQVFVTTHSPVFIDTYNMFNVFLFDLEITSQFYKRKNRNFNVLKTVLIDTSSINGDKKIKDYLGIRNDDFDVLNNHNLMVEGASDALYIEELLKFWGKDTPNIVVLGGADNAPRSLEFYNNFYSGNEFKPKIKLLLDNDHKGREIYDKVLKSINSNKYQNIDVTALLVPNFLGESRKSKDINNEIEDFLYPEIVLLLVNKLLSKKGMKKISIKPVSKQIEQPAFKNSGILTLINSKKNEGNPENGHTVNVESENFKDGMSKNFVLEGNASLIKKVQENDQAYPEVKLFLLRLIQ